MIDNPEQFDNDATRRFLLGRLSPAEQVTFEERLLADDSLATLVRLAECELADDYAFERLSAADRELCRQRFLITAGRHQQLAVSMALRDRFGSTSPASSQAGTTIVERLRRMLGLDRPVRKLAFGIAILILLIGTAWLISREPHINRRLIARRPAATPTATPAEANHPSGRTAPPNHEEVPAPPPIHASPVVVVVVLAQGNVAQVNLPNGERDIVRFRLTPGEGQSGSYRAELLSADGQSVSETRMLNPIDGRIEFDVPARLVKTGEYQVKLRRVGEEGVAAYYFRVQ